MGVLRARRGFNYLTKGTGIGLTEQIGIKIRGCTQCFTNIIRYRLIMAENAKSCDEQKSDLMGFAK